MMLRRGANAADNGLVLQADVGCCEQVVTLPQGPHEALLQKGLSGAGCCKPVTATHSRCQAGHGCFDQALRAQRRRTASGAAMHVVCDIVIVWTRSERRRTEKEYLIGRMWCTVIDD
ncbi:hypothetical protein D1007_56201 [Hordeum vulgare]|nr:hypothetical protein D1007_56201 [Hordeum vulgare]